VVAAHVYYTQSATQTAPIGFLQLVDMHTPLAAVEQIVNHEIYF
jgi:hypothetical protein